MRRNPINGLERRPDTDILLVVDMSWSMRPLTGEVIRLLNDQLRTARALARPRRVRLSVVVFNDPTCIVERLWRAHPREAGDFHPDVYRPSGSTALLDAACQSIDRLAAEMRPEGHARVFFLTDGAENASLRFNLRDLAGRTRRLQATGRWEFRYLGANHDLTWVSRELGFPADHVTAFDPSIRGLDDASTWVSTAIATSVW